MSGHAQSLCPRYVVGLMESGCIEPLGPHLDDGEDSLGVGIAISHVTAALPECKSR
jgi:predicted thioesterase